MHMVEMSGKRLALGPLPSSFTLVLPWIERLRQHRCSPVPQAKGDRCPPGRTGVGVCFHWLTTSTMPRKATRVPTICRGVGRSPRNITAPRRPKIGLAALSVAVLDAPAT